MRATTALGHVSKRMIHPRFAEVATPAPSLEEAAAASAFAGDVYAFLDTVTPYAATLALLAEFAIVAQSVALREAAGRPYDERWRRAYAALEELLAGCLRHSPRAGESTAFACLSKFLAENADLAHLPGSRHSGSAN